jgi:hypothetical protein
MQRRIGNRSLLQRLWSKNIDRYGVLSLSKSNTNSHLWSRYADDGSGVCIRYSFEHIIDTRRVDWLFFEVEYVDKLPAFNMFDFRESAPGAVEEFIRRALRLKTRQWEQEDEVRVVYQVEDLRPPKVRVPPHTITALYLGRAVSLEDRETILGWNTNLPIYKMTMEVDGQETFILLKGKPESTPRE